MGWGWGGEEDEHFLSTVSLQHHYAVEKLFHKRSSKQMHAVTQYSRPYTSFHLLHAQHILKSILRIWAALYFSIQNYFKRMFWPFFIRTYCLECHSVLRSNVFRFQFDFAELSDYLFLHCVLQNPPFCIVNAVTEKRVKTTDSDRPGASIRCAFGV